MSVPLLVWKGHLVSVLTALTYQETSRVNHISPSSLSWLKHKSHPGHHTRPCSSTRHKTRKLDNTQLNKGRTITSTSPFEIGAVKWGHFSSLPIMTKTKRPDHFRAHLWCTAKQSNIYHYAMLVTCHQSHGDHRLSLRFRQRIRSTRKSWGERRKTSQKHKT